MSQASYKKERLPLAPPLVRLVREAALYLLSAAALYLLLALSTYHALDPSWSHAGTAGPVQNAGGRVGAWISDLLYVAFGYIAFVFPAMLGYAAWRMLRHAGPVLDRRARLFGSAGFLLTLIGGCGLADLAMDHNPLRLPFSAGGLLGHLIGGLLTGAFSAVGATIFLLAVFLAGITLFTRLSWLAVMDRTGALVFAAAFWARDFVVSAFDRAHGHKAMLQRRETVAKERRVIASHPPPRVEPIIRPEPGERVERERQAPLFKMPLARGDLPPLSLLDVPGVRKNQFSDEAISLMSDRLITKLADFHIEAVLGEVHPGPVITRFEIDPAPGVKASQISNLARDLARAMSVVSVRVVENIPGKSFVGIEVPNEHRETVYLHEVLSSRVYESVEGGLALALGRDIAGEPVVADLTRMPHLLIAGTTGSGKSVCINALILSLLYKYRPEQCRLIMIDPKMLELAAYEGIPHLLSPVVTDMKQSAQALRWCIFEMERRYRLMSQLGVRNIGGFNKKVVDAANAGRPIMDPLAAEGTEPKPLQPLPFIVILIDELADMMMVVGKKVEELIARLAQKARASGLHLILATQRPSVDVITGLIKANIPTRIAFQMSARVDSRTVLDQMGAEQLLGHGDMLFLQAGSGIPTRVHGAFVADHEVHKVAEFLKQQGAPEYNERILAGEPEEGAEPVYLSADELPTGEADPLYDQALRIVTESRKASISGVQRRLRIGYNRAARLIEEMERVGVVGPLQTNGSREVLAPPAPED